MVYNGRLTPPDNWPPLIRYPRYYPDRRLSILWFLILAIIALLLSVIALIIVFAVEHSWFHDTYNGSTTQYGLWRLCIFANNTCVSWFTTDGTYGRYVENRLDQSRAGINAWQALEIIFLFLTTATLIIAIVALVCYRIRHTLHYYLAILAAFCVWLAASIGVSALFVFGFAVYNVSQVPRDLDWCFYVNLVAVILAVIAAILLSIYDRLLKKPIKTIDDDTVIETFADLNGYPTALSPSTFVIVRRNKKKGSKYHDYPRVLHPNHYFPKTIANGMITNENTTTEYRTNFNQPQLTPYTSIVTTREINTTTQQQQQQQPQQREPQYYIEKQRREIQPYKEQQRPLTPYRNVEYNRPNLITTSSVATAAPQPSIPFQTQSYRRALSPYQYQSRSSPSYWHRTGTNTMNQSTGYASEPSNDYFQRSYVHPTRSNITERIFEQKREPRILHYYTGYDYFATVDPSDNVLTRHHPPLTGLGSTIRYDSNPSYPYQSDYIKSTM